MAQDQCEEKEGNNGVGRTTLAVISGPLSERMWAGMPDLSITSANVSRTPKLLIRR